MNKNFFLNFKIGMCPKGDDPLTASVDYRTIKISTKSSSGALSGSFRFSFNGLSFSFPAAWTEALCEDAFSELQNIEQVSCQISANANGLSNNLDITVNIFAFPSVPYENNIYSNDGNPDLSYFSCDATAAVGIGASCTISDISGISYPG